jgi:hypothetical protein
MGPDGSLRVNLAALRTPGGLSGDARASILSAVSAAMARKASRKTDRALGGEESEEQRALAEEVGESDRGAAEADAKAAAVLAATGDHTPTLPTGMTVGSVVAEVLGSGSGTSSGTAALPPALFDRLALEAAEALEASGAIPPRPTGRERLDRDAAEAAAAASLTPNAQWVRSVRPAAIVARLRQGGAPQCNLMLAIYAERGQARRWACSVAF